MSGSQFLRSASISLIRAIRVQKNAGHTVNCDQPTCWRPVASISLPQPPLSGMKKPRVRDSASPLLRVTLSRKLTRLRVVPKVRFACDVRMLLHVLDLLCSEAELFFMLSTPFFPCQRRTAAFAPVVLHGDQD